MTRLLLLCLLASGSVSAAPRAICMAGDSLTYGYTFDATPIADRLSALRGVPVVNMGVGSDVAASIKARWVRYCAPYQYRFAIWEGCTNDFGVNSATGADCWATTEDWIDAVTAAGQTPIVLGVFPRGGSSGWTSPKETQRQAWLASAAAYAAAHTGMIYIPMDTVLGDGASPPALQAGYDWGDHLHIDGDGMQVVAQAIADAL